LELSGIIDGPTKDLINFFFLRNLRDIARSSFVNGGVHLYKSIHPSLVFMYTIPVHVSFLCWPPPVYSYRGKYVKHNVEIKIVALISIAAFIMLDITGTPLLSDKFRNHISGEDDERDTDDKNVDVPVAGCFVRGF